MKFSRIISSISYENLSFFKDIDNDVTDSANCNDRSNADEDIFNPVLDDIPDTKLEGCIDIRHKQNEIMKRNDNITFTPTTTALSQSLLNIPLQAVSIATSEEEHAVSTVIDGPSKPRE